MSAGRPKGYTFTLEGRIERARIVGMPQSGDPSEIVCMDCVPQRTKMTAVMDNIQYSLLGDRDKYWTIFQCQTCKKFSVVEYTLEGDNNG